MHVFKISDSVYGELLDLGHVQVCELRDTGPHRRVISPGDDISGETPEMQALCNEWWTPERLAAYAEAMAASEPQS